MLNVVVTNCGFSGVEKTSGSICSKMSSRGKFVKKANHCASCVQGTSNNKKSDVAKFATRSEPI